MCFSMASAFFSAFISQRCSSISSHHHFTYRNLHHLGSCISLSLHLSCLSSLLSSGAKGAWLTARGDITPVPLLCRPDLDALCDPVAPALSAPLPRSSPPRSSSLSTSILFSSPHSQLIVSPSAPPTQSGTPAS